MRTMSERKEAKWNRKKGRLFLREMVLAVCDKEGRRDTKILIVLCGCCAIKIKEFKN